MYYEICNRSNNASDITDGSLTLSVNGPQPDFCGTSLIQCSGARPETDSAVVFPKKNQNNAESNRIEKKIVIYDQHVLISSSNFCRNVCKTDERNFEDDSLVTGYFSL